MISSKHCFLLLLLAASLMAGAVVDDDEELHPGRMLPPPTARCDCAAVPPGLVCGADGNSYASRCEAGEPAARVLKARALLRCSSATESLHP